MSRFWMARNQDTLRGAKLHCYSDRGRIGPLGTQVLVGFGIARPLPPLARVRAGRPLAVGSAPRSERGARGSGFGLPSL